MHRMAFIGGLHRSGTSPLYRVLASHPSISGFTNTGVPEDEGQHLQDLIPTAGQHGGVGRFALDRASHLTEHDARCTVVGRRALMASWAQYWDASAEVWVEKSPPNLVRFRFLQGLFSDSVAIAVVRHPLVVALATAKWARFTSLRTLLEHWCVAHERFAEDLPYLDPVIVVRFERFVSMPDAVTRGVAELLGVKPQFDLSRVRPDANDRYVRAWREQRPSWRARSRRRLLSAYRDRVERLGYVLDEPEADLLPGPWEPNR